MLESSYDKGICFGVVEKLSGMGYKFHKRLLLLEDGVLSYYSKVPSNAEEGFLSLIAFKAMNVKPKLSLQAMHIQSVNQGDKTLTDKKKKSHVFVVEFKKSAFTTSKKKDNEKGKNEQEQEWVFSVNTLEEYEKWTNILNQAKGSETVTELGNPSTSATMLKVSGRRQNLIPPIPGDSNENSVTEPSPVNVQSMIKARQGVTKPSILITNKMQENQEEGELSPAKSSPGKADRLKKMKSVHWKEPGVFQTDMNEIKYEDRLREIEEELRMKRRMEEERKRQEDEMREIKRKELAAMMSKQRMEEESKRKERQDKLKYAWEHIFNTKISETLKSSHSIEEKIKSGFEMAKYVGEFRTEAVDLCKSIIDELSLPSSEKVYSMYEKTPNNKSKTLQKMFVFSGLIVRITWADRENVETGDQVYSELYTDKMIKSFSHEFRAINILNDILYLLNKDRGELAYRVPLTALVDYKGFRCLVTSNPPVDGDDTLQMGPIMSSGAYRANADMDNLDYIAQELKLKKHKFLLDDNETTVDVQLSVFTEVHKVTFSATDDDKNEMKIPTVSDNRIGFGNRNVYTCNYIMKTADIFPVDIDLEGGKNPSFLKRLRPEFMLEYEKPLSADALVNNSNAAENTEDEEDDMDVIQAGIHLRTVVIPAFVKKLDSLEIMMVDSASLTQALHCHGINIRYLGLIAQQTNLPHVREICIMEMIARAAKKILRKEISSLVLEALEEERDEGNEGKDRSGLQGLTSKPVNIKDEDRRVSRAKALLKSSEMDQNIGECVVELLNFIFGGGKDSARFWSEILSEQILYDYDYNMKNFQKTEVTLGGLLHAVIYHCNIKIEIDDEMQEKLNKVPNPFSRAHFDGIKPTSKVFSLHSLDVKSLSERYAQTRAAKQYDAAIKSCLLAQSMEKLMAYKGENNENPVLLGEMGELHFEKGQLDKAYELATEALSHSRLLHVEALKSLCIMMKVHTLRNETELALENLEHAIQRLNFHLGLYHPLYPTIYSMLGSYYAQTKNFQDALLLYKESLGRCKRDLGPNHPITGQVYVDLGNLTLKMHQQEDALNYFEHAFCVFEASKSNESIECADMSYMMATLLMSFGKIKEAMAAVEHALKIYEKNEGDFVEKIAECCLLVCSIGESRNNDKLTLDHANKIWSILNKMPTKNEMHYKSRILTLTLTALIHGLTADKKNFLYYIADSIVDVLGQENMLDKLYGGGEDTTLQKKYLEIIFTKSQSSKNIRNLLRDILKTLFQKLQEKDLKAFFINYRKNLEVLDDLQLKECLNDFEMLIFIHGIQYFHDAFKKF